MLKLFFTAHICAEYYFYANVPDIDAALFYTLKKLNLKKITVFCTCKKIKNEV
jgi:hypothetical protein